MTTPTTALLSASLALLLFAGCERAEPVTYQIPKETSKTAPTELPAGHPPVNGTSASNGSMQMLPGMAEAAAAAPGIEFTIPAGWEDAGATSMRKANLRIEGAEITALTFPGDVGGTLANINRWATQVGAAELTEATLDTATTPTTLSNHGGLYVSLDGPTESIRGGILPFHGDTWFFKMKGPSEVVRSNEAAFKEFLASVRIEDAHH